MIFSKRLNELSIPNVDMELLPTFAEYDTRLLIHYYNLVNKTGYGQKVLEILKEDSRVCELNGKMISRGDSAEQFDVTRLAAWFLWCVNTYGKKEATSYLDSFLECEKIEVLNTLWLLGIEVDRSISLCNGYSIRSIKDMPDSREKDFFLKKNVLPYGPIMKFPVPACAITKPCYVFKAWGDVPPDSRETIDIFFKVQQQLYEVALLLNIIDGVFCIPYFLTSYPAPTTPFGYFGGSGGSSTLYDVSCVGVTKLRSESITGLNELIEVYEKLPLDQKRRIMEILNRLSQTKRRTQIADKILDLGITLEMLLLDNQTKDEQLSLSFRLRGSWLLGDSGEERLKIYKQLREIYKYRSQVAHSGVLCDGDSEKIVRVKQSYSEYLSLAERICQKIIQNGVPDWDKILLNA